MNFVSPENCRLVFKNEEDHFQSYWKRVETIKEVISYLNEGNDKIEFKQDDVLELAPMKYPVFSDSVLITHNDWKFDEWNINNKRVLHYWNVTPYPLQDDTFKLTVAIDIMPFLDDQRRAWRECVRLSDFLLFATPVDEKNSKYPEVKVVDLPRISEWTMGSTPYFSTIRELDGIKYFFGLYDLRPYKNTYVSCFKY